MAELVPFPFALLAARMLRELEQRRSIFDLPEKKFFLGDATRSFGVRFHGRPASTPFGPAAGPHSQMAQNLVLSWLAGGRIFELKTVQILDQLEIPRPCIDMETIGYNAEWSQELRLEQSLEEYVKGSMLIRILSSELPVVAGYEHAIFDMSVGYDLAGIRSERVQAFLSGMQDASAVVDRLRAELPAELSRVRDLDYPTRLSSTLTLSTFHGCPPDEIEKITEYLLESGIDCVVKLNPTLLGPDEMQRLLHDRLGYHQVRVPPSAFEKDTSWQKAVDFCGRLAEKARALGRSFGVKFSNTLICENHRSFFPSSVQEMYLSGPPLHVLAVSLVQRFRQQFGSAIPISFSAGIDRQNFADAVSLGLVPVTACSDLLRNGGYGRAQLYFRELGKRMSDVGAGEIDAFVVRAHGQGEAALARLGLAPETQARALGALRDKGDLSAAVGPELLSQWAREAAVLNTEVYARRVQDDPRYAAEKNRTGPKRIAKQLASFDCVTCDICIPVCPNDANFSFVPPERELPILKARRTEAGWQLENGGKLSLAERHQIGTFADFCNECGNCDVFCPETGAPYALKPRFFGRRADYERFADRPGFCLEIAEGTERVLGRFEQGEFSAEISDGWARYQGAGFELRFRPDSIETTLEGRAEGEVDLTFFLIMDALRRGLLGSEQTSYVSLLARAPAGKGSG